MTKSLFSNFEVVNFIRSPLFYVGDKYKLMPQLSSLFPNNINRYFEPFCGGGSSFLNTKAKKYFLNDIDKNIISLHKFLSMQNSQDFFIEIFNLIESYSFSCSYKNLIPPKDLRDEYKKTYFAHFNKLAYKNLKDDYNSHKNDILKLYLLLIYGFNHMLRFNKNGDFNLPVGNVDFNANVVNALNGYFTFCKRADLSFFNLDFIEFLENFNYENGDFIYFDPPYLISDSEYNKIWSDECENSLYALLERLDKNGVKWGLSNLVHHKGKTNDYLLEFSKKYKIYDIKSNYISFNNNSLKKHSREIYITNAYA